VARRIRQRRPEGGIFVAALSGWGSGSDRQQSEQAGFDVHLTKPVAMAALGQVLHAGRAEGWPPSRPDPAAQRSRPASSAHLPQPFSRSGVSAVQIPAS
jgi:DNA-binding response OmpR family regulator